MVLDFVVPYLPLPIFTLHPNYHLLSLVLDRGYTFWSPWALLASCSPCYCACTCVCTHKQFIYDNFCQWKNLVVCEKYGVISLEFWLKYNPEASCQAFSWSLCFLFLLGGWFDPFVSGPLVAINWSPQRGLLFSQGRQGMSGLEGEPQKVKPQACNWFNLEMLSLDSNFITDKHFLKGRKIYLREWWGIRRYGF